MHSPVVSSKFESKELACDDCSAVSVVPDWGLCMICTTTDQVSTARDLRLKSTLIFFTSKDVPALVVINNNLGYYICDVGMPT